MKNIKFTAALFTTLLPGFAAIAAAQNLYISNLKVGDGGYNYCVTAANDGLGVGALMAAPGQVDFITDTGNVWERSSLINYDRPQASYPGGCLALCASVSCMVPSTPTVFGIDDLTFEIFKFGAGANPLDPSSTPPIKTISLFPSDWQCSFLTDADLAAGPQLLGTKCAAWDGFYNINGMFGKTNGQYGFRAKVTTRQTTADGASVDIEQTAAFPGQNQVPIQVNVANIHMVQSSPTAVGSVTRVSAQPYNLRYRLSEDATATITIWDNDITHALPGGGMQLVRTVINSQPRVGEGIPDGVLTNGDWWDGRNASGVLVPAGSYIARIEASSNNGTRTDLAWPATIQLTLDPLQVTDVGMRPLGASSTDMATVSYLLTEAATSYVEIYTPGTQFQNTNTSPPQIVPGTGELLRRFTEQQEFRRTANTYWDGRDGAGRPVCDGNYVYAVYAALPSAGTYGDGSTWSSIKTKTTVGTVPVARGQVLAFLTPSPTGMGSSSPVSGLDPFYFRYTPERNTTVSLNIKDMLGNVVRRVVDNEARPSGVVNREVWDGKDDDGLYVSSANYLAELITTDPYQCQTNSVSTMTALIQVNLFRIVDARTTPLLGGASAYATVSYELSQTMYTKLDIYPVSVTIDPSAWPWTGGQSEAPVYSVQGVRPGRMRITEPWEGKRASNGEVMPDGRYPFTLVAYSTGTSDLMMATDKVYGYLDVTRGEIAFSAFQVYPNIPTMYSSSETIALPPYGIEYAVTRQSSVTVQVVSLENNLPYAEVRIDVTDSKVREGETLYKDFWDGRCTNTPACPNKEYAPAGPYYIRALAQELGNELKQSTTRQELINFNPFQIYDLSIAPLTPDTQGMVSYQVSETMKVATMIYTPSTNLTGYSASADRLVKRIVGVRPARTQIFEYWDGTDLELSKVPDGNYVFIIYGSTVTGNIRTSDGNITSAAQIADYEIQNIPVIKNGPADMCGEFAAEAFFAPNPYTGNAGWFYIPAVGTGSTLLHIYNLAGDMVYSKDFGLRGLDQPVDGGKQGLCTATTHSDVACWPRVNNSGRTVAPGVYFAVLRFEATEGSRTVCQVVKKILVP